MSQENPRTSAPLAPLQLVFVQLPEKKTQQFQKHFNNHFLKENRL